MPGFPLPNLTFAAPSQSAATGTNSAPFNIGSGSAGGIPMFVWLGALALGALYLYRKA